jgi:hypothetical protein
MKKINQFWESMVQKKVSHDNFFQLKPIYPGEIIEMLFYFLFDNQQFKKNMLRPENKPSPYLFLLKLDHNLLKGKASNCIHPSSLQYMHLGLDLNTKSM